MINRKSLTLATLVAAFWACGDMMSPAANEASWVVSAKANGKKVTDASLDGATASTDEPTSDIGTSGSDREIDASVVPASTIAQRADAPPLMTYRTAFTAVQGEGNTFVVFYQNPWNLDAVTQGDWFMKLDIPMDAQLLLPDGSPAAPGDSVEITVEIDRSLFFVQFGPHGSRFDGRKPAILAFNYAFADVDKREESDLKVWYQPDAGETWGPESTDIDVKRNKVTVDLYHFSNYAIAF